MYGIFEVSLENGKWKGEPLSFCYYEEQWHEIRNEILPEYFPDGIEIKKLFYLKDAVKLLDSLDHSLRHALIIVDENEVPSNE